jgi:mannose-6-phosphate isomerase-like protein (cupin superfamily)
MQGYVVAEQDVPAQTVDGTASVRVTIDARAGSERLEQRVVRFAPGRSRLAGVTGQQELLYVVSGNGAFYLNGHEHPLEPGTGIYVSAGDRYEVENPGPDELLAVSVLAPSSGSAAPAADRRTVGYGDQPPLPAGADREFRYLVTQEVGCLDVTRFVGTIPPGRAPDHSHVYDEVVYVIEGEGTLHIDGRQTPISAGTCIHLPPLVEHCLENTGTVPMRVLGVFHPSGDPASRASEASE